MGYRLNRLDEPVFMAVPKPMLTECGIHYRLESCALLTEFWVNHRLGSCEALAARAYLRYTIMVSSSEWAAPCLSPITKVLKNLSPLPASWSNFLPVNGIIAESRKMKSMWFSRVLIH